MSKKVFTGTEWKEITDIALDGLPIGFSLPFRGKIAPYGWLVEDGSTLQIATYPDLFKTIGTTYGGDGITTFNLPNSIGKYIRGGLADEVGIEVEAGLPNITGRFDARVLNTDTLGAFQINGGGSSGNGAGSANISDAHINFDASRSSDIYGKSNTVTPPTLVALPCIKAFNTIVETNGITTTNLAAEIEALKATQMISTIIYPNGGTDNAPANVNYNSRYVMENPFPGYFVQCEVQLLLNNIWGCPSWSDMYGNSNQAWGAMAFQLGGRSENIVVQTALLGLYRQSSHSGNPFGDSFVTSSITSAPCRVIVTRLGKILIS